MTVPELVRRKRTPVDELRSEIVPSTGKHDRPAREQYVTKQA
jgi:hypothetical protein